MRIRIHNTAFNWEAFLRFLHEKNQIDEASVFIVILPLTHIGDFVTTGIS